MDGSSCSYRFFLTQSYPGHWAHTARGLEFNEILLTICKRCVS